MVAGAAIVLFPSEGQLEAAPPPAAGSSEVTRVTASPQEETGGPADTPAAGGPVERGPAATTPTATGSPPDGIPGSPTDGQPPVIRQPAGNGPSGGGEEPPAEEPPATDDKLKQNDPDRRGKAKGHDKSHGKGKAKGHDKWHGTYEEKEKEKKKSHGAPVAFDPPHGQKHGHVDHPGAGK
jgi:hypothetical protein